MKAHTFDYDTNRGDPNGMIQLTCHLHVLKDCAREVFAERVIDEGFDSVLEDIAGSFEPELREMAARSLSNIDGSFWDYVFENTNFISSDLVLNKAQQQVIQEYKEYGGF